MKIWMLCMMKCIFNNSDLWVSCCRALFTYVKILVKVVYRDIVQFLVVFFMTVVAFGGALYLALRGEPCTIPQTEPGFHPSVNSSLCLHPDETALPGHYQIALVESDCEIGCWWLWCYFQIIWSCSTNWSPSAGWRRCGQSLCIWKDRISVSGLKCLLVHSWSYFTQMARCDYILALFVCGVHYSTEPPDRSVRKHVWWGVEQGPHIHSIGKSCCSPSNWVSSVGVGAVPDGLALLQEENSSTGETPVISYSFTKLTFVFAELSGLLLPKVITVQTKTRYYYMLYAQL